MNDQAKSPSADDLDVFAHRAGVEERVVVDQPDIDDKREMFSRPELPKPASTWSY